MRTIAAILLSLAVLAAAGPSGAFCGFYVSGADTKLFNNATLVVVMRDGLRTVLSMQNDYEGPPEDFALVVPVPVVLRKENVRVLGRGVFQRVDELTAPRLVEYWEEDPCHRPSSSGMGGCACAPMMGAKMPVSPSSRTPDYGVRVEAKFEVGEYEVVVLSAQDSSGLEAWLHDNKYKIPAGAEPHLRPYVQSGSKFFVAKVDTKKVAFERGRAVLSPLRFHYDAERFELPIRLGLVNSAGTQDLVVIVLSDGRYEVANYANATIPTNLEIAEAARERFGPVYAALFDRTLERNPGAVVTEYSWAASSCDPCPTPPLSPEELALFGADVLSDATDEDDALRGTRRDPRRSHPWVVTRLHARYTKEALGQDLVFRKAPPITGGRETDGARSPRGAQPSSDNNFQARYVIRHPWAGAIQCSDPIRDRWGPPPDGESSGTDSPRAATNLAFVARGTVELSPLLREDVSELGLVAGAPPQAPRPAARSGSCAGCAIAERGGGWTAGLLAALGLVAYAARRRRRG